MPNQANSNCDATQLSDPAGQTTIRGNGGLAPGDLLSERFEIGVLLGQGGTGSVYAARDTLEGRDVAIKVLLPALIDSEQARERFMAGASVCCELSHPNIVRVYEVGVSGDVGMGGPYWYLSMERLRGQTLRERLNASGQSGLPLAVVTAIARQIVEALQHAQRFLVHRDIEPENIWVCEDGTVKLMDFGIARALVGSGLTRTGRVFGTSNYLAPEQRLSAQHEAERVAKELDWRADQYSLGVVLYEVLTGSLPTAGSKPLATVRRDLSRRHARAVMRAMSAKPEDRWPSWQVLLAELVFPQGSLLGPAAAILAGIVVAVTAATLYVNRREMPQEFRDPLTAGGRGPIMVVIPAGTFLMGSPQAQAQRDADEGPQHTVRIEQFALARTEVSFDEYDRFATATQRALPDDAGWGRGTRPVINVTWQDATDYAAWLSRQTGEVYRLPTAAEWEYAARTPFDTGECSAAAQASSDARAADADPGCAAANQFLARARPAGSFAGSRFGLRDMHGNFHEWVADCFRASHSGAPVDDRARLEPADGDCSHRVLRGGSSNLPAPGQRSTFRDGSREASANDVGFRLARNF